MVTTDCTRTNAGRVSMTWLHRSAVVAVLGVHAAMLAYSAAIHSPTIDEPAHRAAGIDHWRTGNFRGYCVNPHFPRMAAALPVMLLAREQVDRVPGVQDLGDQRRPEFIMGRRLVAAWRGEVFGLMTLARWACLPFSVMGGLACCLWAQSLYGRAGGLLGLFLWCFLPEILGHGALVTADVPAAAAGVWAGWMFWRFLRLWTWTAAGWAGLAMGLALLTKSTWLILFLLWPIVWMVAGRRRGGGAPTSKGDAEISSNGSLAGERLVDPECRVRIPGNVPTIG
jgi:hypothetical protein